MSQILTFFFTGFLPDARPPGNGRGLDGAVAAAAVASLALPSSAAAAAAALLPAPLLVRLPVEGPKRCRIRKGMAPQPMERGAFLLCSFQLLMPRAATPAGRGGLVTSASAPQLLLRCPAHLDGPQHRALAAFAAVLARHQVPAAAVEQQSLAGQEGSDGCAAGHKALPNVPLGFPAKDTSVQLHTTPQVSCRRLGRTLNSSKIRPGGRKARQHPPAAVLGMRPGHGGGKPVECAATRSGRVRAVVGLRLVVAQVHVGLDFSSRFQLQQEGDRRVLRRCWSGSARLAAVPCSRRRSTLGARACHSVTMSPVPACSPRPSSAQ